MERQIEHAVEQLLGGGHGGAIDGGEFLRQRERLLHQPFRRDDAVDEAERFRLRGVQRLSGRGQLERGLDADMAHQIGHHDRGDDAVPDLRIADLRGCRHHGKVAAEGEARAAAHRGAVDRGDDRLREFAEKALQFHGRLRPALDQVRLIGCEVLEFGEIGARAEGCARAGQHNAAYVIVRIGSVPSSDCVSTLLSALRLSGRFKVRMRTPPRSSISRLDIRWAPRDDAIGHRCNHGHSIVTVL